MPTRPFYLALLFAAVHAGAAAQVIKCTDAGGRTTYQGTPCATAQGAREQNMATPGRDSGAAPVPAPAAPSQKSGAPAAPSQQAEMDAFNARMNARMCEVHRVSLKRLKESETMLVTDGNGIKKADGARRASEIAQAEQRVRETCK